MPDWASDPYWGKYWDLANRRGTSMYYEEAAARGDWQTAREHEIHWVPLGGGWYSDTGTINTGAANFSYEQIDFMEGNTHFQFRGDSASSAGPILTPQARPVSPTFDPKIDANILYGKPMALFAGGYARIGAGPAPIVGPYINGDIADFVVSFGVPANPEGERKLYRIWLDQELAWESVAGGTLPGDGLFSSTPFDFVFKPGTLTQTAVSLESEKFPGDENAYRPQMILELRNLPIARWMELTGKPIPYVAAEIGDVSDGVTTPQDGINLGLALQRVAFSPWCGYTSANFEWVNITDIVGAILIKDNFNFVQLCQSITGEYRNIDLLVSDKVWIKDRASDVSPNFIFDRDTIIAGDAALTVARANATSMRREHELFAIDPDQDYTAIPSLSKIPRDPMTISAAVGKDTKTVPLVIDANTRQALATFSQNYDENARRKISFKVPALGYEIEPGDLYAVRNIASGFDNEVFKAISTTHGANWVVDVEGEAILRCNIFRDVVPGSVVVTSGDQFAGVRYCYVEGTGPQEWHRLWGDGLADSAFYSVGSVVASSYGKPGGRPTFLMGGTDFYLAFGANAIIALSHDAITWTRVYYGRGMYEPGPEPVRLVIYNLVWDEAEGAFYADYIGPVANGVTVPSPTSFCLRSEDGYTWENIGDNFWYHTRDGKTPDGRTGYDPETGLTIIPSDLELGTVVYCTAYANGVWFAGGNGSDGGSATWISYDGGVNWSVTASGVGIQPGWNATIRTMVAAPTAEVTG